MVTICRYGEIFLKGQNKGKFEHALVLSLKKKLASHNIHPKINMLHNRIIVENDESYYLKTVCGLTSVSRAVQVPIEMDAIIKTAFQLLPKQFSSFKVHARRITKTGRYNSTQLNETVGEAIFETLNVPVHMKNPEVMVGIEIVNDSAYIFTEKLPCPGGLPEGVSGVITIPSADPHAELAGLLLLKRGCSIVFTGKHAFPIFDSYTTESAETPIACARGTLSIVRTLYNLPELYPLIGMTEEDVKLNLNHFKSLVKP